MPVTVVSRDLGVGYHERDVAGCEEGIRLYTC